MLLFDFLWVGVTYSKCLDFLTIFPTIQQICNMYLSKLNYQYSFVYIELRGIYTKMSPQLSDTFIFQLGVGRVAVVFLFHHIYVPWCFFLIEGSLIFILRYHWYIILLKGHWFDFIKVSSKPTLYWIQVQHSGSPVPHIIKSSPPPSCSNYLSA